MQTVTHEQEITKVREFLRTILLGILEADTFDPAIRNTTENMVSQSMLRAFFNVLKALYDTGYQDMDTLQCPLRQLRHNTSKAIHNFHDALLKAADINGDFIVAREILIQRIQEVEIEQKFHIAKLLRAEPSTIRTPELYQLQAAPMVTWIPDELK